MNGPYQTEQEARDSEAAEAVRELPHGSPEREAAKAQVILDACARHGVTTGAYDERIIYWLAGYGTEACAVIAGLIERAASEPWRYWELGKHFSTEARCPDCGGDVMITDDCVFPAGSDEADALGRDAIVGDLTDAIRAHECPAGGESDG